MKTHTIIRRPAVAAFATGGLVVALAACGTSGDTSATGGPSASGGAPGGATVELTFDNFYTGSDIATMNTLVDAFNAANPGIHVTSEAIDGNTLTSQIPSQVAAGQAPDVLATHDISLPQLAGAGALQVLASDDLSSAGVSKDDYFSNIWDYGTQGGDLYGVPFGATGAVMFYNNTLMKQSGVDAPPTDYDSLVAAGQQCTADAAGKHPTDAGFDPSTIATYGVGIDGGVEEAAPTGVSVLAQEGGSLWNDSYDPAFDSDAGKLALTTLTGLIDTEHISPAALTYSADIANFRGGKSCFMFTGPWEYQGNKDAGLDFGIAPFPQIGSKTYAAWGGAAWLSLPKQPDSYGADKHAAALKFVAWMTGSEGSLMWTKSGNLPARPDVANGSDYASSPTVEVAKKLDSLFIPTGFPWIAELNNGWSTAYVDVLSNGTDPSAALSGAAADAKQNVDSARPNYPEFTS